MRLTAWLLTWMLCGVTQTASAQALQIGVVERLNGTVTVTPAGEAVRPLADGDPVREGDLVVTAANSETLIKLRDETTLALRQNSQLYLAEYKFDKAASDSFVARLLKGAVRKVSGLIARSQPRNVRLTTPTATVGIRGTDYEVTIVEEESPDTRAGTYDYVNDGETSLTIATGESLNVERDQTGLALANPRPGEAVLQLIQGRPAFLRGGGFDSMMLQLTRPPVIIIPRR